MFPIPHPKRSMAGRNEKFLILVRHAESKLNAARKEAMAKPFMLFKTGLSHCIDPGVRDAPLTSEGQRQAQRAGSRLARDILAGYLPPLQVVGVSPLRRTLHTLRLLSDNADSELCKVAKERIWWQRKEDSQALTTESFPGPTRTLVVVPYLRERKTTSADQPCVRPSQAVAFWKNRPVTVQVLHPADLPQSFRRRISGAKASTPARLNHFFTVGITQRYRKVNVESVDNVLRRVLMLEAWVRSRPEKVIMLVGHNMIFKAWQKFWQNAGTVQWASREEVLKALREEQRRAYPSPSRRTDTCDCCHTVDDDDEQGGKAVSHSVDKIREASTNASWPCDSVSCGGCGEFERVMRERSVNAAGKVYECPNTGMLLVRWVPNSQSTTSFLNV
eukprot:Protomagalhaensia_sp_Gyna_25__4557@NODE_41_length_6542_cov_264_111179_g30_i0_p4_GENE_NODE_41_length_6542_cov_264_111179_g30_i0NODE_41_length_6542_cov_264_111179_g30_i0_p4_ORF_typecomplete_len389_score39_65His_Phos_1/PF00300_22/2e14Mannosyl_trans3/PF11051_8/0_14_NODE_41_length_6542_cov_264_111179_g30_i040135179